MSMFFISTEASLVYNTGVACPEEAVLFTYMLHACLVYLIEMGSESSNSI